MVDSTVSALTAAAALNGAELLYGVQSANDVKITATQLRVFASSIYNVQDYGWLPDGTNRSTQALALLATATAVGGGTLFFPASTGTYRADSQLLIPNDGATGPNNLAQANIAFVGAGGGQIWGRGARDSVGASVLDLRYTAVDGNAKIESRGAGSLLIENLTFVDGGASNATPFIHTSNTTLTVRGNTFIGTGHASQDAIVLGGVAQVAGNGVDAPFQGYGTIIDGNHFRKLNRGVYGRAWSNSVTVTNNSWLASVGTRAIEFAAPSGNSPDIITGLMVTGNTIEMADPMIYGVVLQAVKNSYFANTFNDPGSTYVSDYRLALGTYTSGYSATNVFEQLLSGGHQFTVSTSDTTPLALNTIIGAGGSVSNPFNDGIAASFFTGGAEVDGVWNTGNAAAGALNVRSKFDTNELLCFGRDASNAYVDAWNAAGSWRPLILQPRGGPVIVSRMLAITPTALTLANGLNSNIDLWATDTTAKSSFIRITGPSAAFSIGGFRNITAGGGTPGSTLILYNSTSQAMTLVNEDASSTAAWRIKTLTGANVTLRTGTSSATLIYDNTDARWILIASN